MAYMMYVECYRFDNDIIQCYTAQSAFSGCPTYRIDDEMQHLFY